MEGTSEFRILSDKWTAVSVDDKRFSSALHVFKRSDHSRVLVTALLSLPITTNEPKWAVITGKVEEDVFC